MYDDHNLIIFFCMYVCMADYKRGFIPENSRRVGFRVFGEYKREGMAVSDEYVWEWKHKQRERGEILSLV